MKIGILGTSTVGRYHAEKLVSLGHEVMIGTQDPEQTLSRTGKDEMGNPPFSSWQTENPKVELGTFAQAAEFGELLIDALKGAVAVDVFNSIPKELLKGKILIDIANPLDFPKGMRPKLFVSNTDSLGEQIQRALPEVKVVKTFNTISAYLQTYPEELAGADHTIFLCGNDAEAKDEVTKLLQKYGWKDILDLGDIESARGIEMLLPIWLQLWGSLGTAKFNFKIVR